MLPLPRLLLPITDPTSVVQSLCCFETISYDGNDDRNYDGCCFLFGWFSVPVDPSTLYAVYTSCFSLRISAPYLLSNSSAVIFAIIVKGDNGLSSLTLVCGSLHPSSGHPRLVDMKWPNKT